MNKKKSKPLGQNKKTKTQNKKTKTLFQLGSRVRKNKLASLNDSLILPTKFFKEK